MLESWPQNGFPVILDTTHIWFNQNLIVMPGAEHRRPNRHGSAEVRGVLVR